MEKYKIGIFIDAFYPMIDGVITVVDNIAKSLIDKLDVTVFTISPYGKQKDTINHPYKVVRCKSFPLPNLDYDIPMPNFDKQFKRELKLQNLDLVYCHSPVYMASQAIKYAKKHKIPVLAHLHSQYKRDIYRATHSKLLTNIVLKIFLKNFNKCDCAIAVNEFTANLFKNEYHLKVPIKIIYNATDMLPVEDKKSAFNLINERYSLKPEEKVLLYVGRINKLKNIDLILESLQILIQKMSNVKLLLVGNGNDEDYFRKKIQDLKIENNVIFAGKITDRKLLQCIYSRADLFLFPSHYDTDGLVKIEAASQGTPTVFVENTGASSSIKDNLTGFIAKNDKFSYSNKIFEVLQNKDLYDKASKNIQTMLYRTWQDSASEIYDIIVKMIESNKQTKLINSIEKLKKDDKLKENKNG